MFSEIEHSIFVKGDWDLEKITNYFGENPAILINALKRRSCTVDVVELLLNHGVDVNYEDCNAYTALMTALEISNDKEVIRELLKAGAEVNKLDIRRRTSLMRFLQRKDCSVGIVEVLLDFEADVNRKDKYGESPLVAAIRNSHDDKVVHLLVERGAEVDDLRDLYNTPLLVLLRERKKCSVDTVKFLLAYSANINCADKNGNSPLLTALRNSRNEAVIQALLENGANVNIVCKYFKTPLLTALENSSEAVIRKLLESGADVNTLDAKGKSPLCIAFRHSSNDVQILLFDSGSSPNACKYHESALHCATDFSYSGLRKDILKLLLKKEVDMNCVDEYGQSVLCFALHHGAIANDIQLLLDKGALLSTCRRHSSPLMCATDGWHGTPLREDVVQLLLDNGAYVNDQGLKILQSALRYCNYEFGAIQLLLDLPGMDAYVVSSECDESLLHLAVQNPNCRLNAVKLLVNRKLPVHKVDQRGETPLHWAVRNETCDPSIVKFLLQNGSPVNAMNMSGETPLMLAVNIERHVNVLTELLIAGAHIGKSKFKSFSFEFELLEFLVRRFERCDDEGNERLKCYRMLLKFFLLQNPNFDMGDFERDPAARSFYKNKLLIFTNKCLGELEKMDSMQVGHGHTFRMFVSRDSLSVENIYDLNQILISLMKNKFPVYFDVITARIDRSVMEAEVNKLQVYTSVIRPDLLYVKRVQLNCDIVCKISQYLPDEDLLKFILVFYKPVNQNDCGETSKDDTLLGKRNSEPSSRPRKQPKLCP